MTCRDENACLWGLKLDCWTCAWVRFHLGTPLWLAHDSPCVDGSFRGRSWACARNLARAFQKSLRMQACPMRQLFILLLQHLVWGFLSSQQCVWWFPGVTILVFQGIWGDSSVFRGFRNTWLGLQNDLFGINWVYQTLNLLGSSLPPPCTFSYLPPSCINPIFLPTFLPSSPFILLTCLFTNSPSLEMVWKMTSRLTEICIYLITWRLSIMS